jgi:transcription initiation factor TFIID TATA-box-binding protein
MPKARKQDLGDRFVGVADPALPFTGVGPHISNVVCGMDLNCQLDLSHIAKSARNAVYRPNRFPAVVLRIREPKATALVFGKGRMQVLGTKNVGDAKLASRKFMKMIEKMGFNARITDFTVQNIVGNADCKMVLRLEGLLLHCRQNKVATVTYEPELFPGLILKIDNPKMTLLVFAKGKVVFLGAKSKEDLEDALLNVWPTLLKFKHDS